MFGNVERRKVFSLEEIQRLDLKEESTGLEGDKRTRKKWRLEFDRILEMEEVMWRQKSQVQWLKEGDGNTAFFHKMANAHRAINSIDVLLEEGVRVE